MGEAGRQRKKGGGVKEGRVRTGRWESQERGREKAAEERQRGETNGGDEEAEGRGTRQRRGLSPRQEARSGPARCPGGQTHSKEPSVLVQMPLWQRSSSLHSSTSAGQCRKPQANLLLCLTFQATPLHRPFPAPPAPRPYNAFPTCLRLLPFLQAPPLRRVWLHPFHSLPNLSRLRPFPFCLPTPPLPFPPFPDPGPAWVRTEARGSARSGPVTGSTSTGKGAVGVEALAVGEAKVALQALVHV